MRRFAVGLVLLALTVPAPSSRKRWTPERRALQTRTCIEAYWDVHPDVTPTAASSRQIVAYCTCVTDEWAKRVDYDAVDGRDSRAAIVAICRRQVGLY